MTKRIYLSSTYRDLHRYRAQAMETLKFLEKYFALVTSMENMMPGSDQPPLESCLSFVETCDIYVLIVGKLYGSIADPQGRSFTEREYLAAKAAGKIVLAFFADPDAEGLAEIATDDAVALSDFIGRVKSTQVAFQKNFSGPYHLSTQLTLALYQFADLKWELLPQIKLRCDRSPQYDTMVVNRKRGRLNAFTIICKGDDRPDFFLERMGVYEFGLQREYIEEGLDTGILFGNYREQFRERFILHLLKCSFDAFNDDLPATLEEGLALLVRRDIKKAFLCFHLSASDVEDADTSAGIRLLLAELESACKAQKFTMFFTFVFEFRGELNRNVLEPIRMAKDFPLFELEPFRQLNERDAITWLRTYITKDNDQIDRIKAFLFGELTEMPMRSIYTKLTDVPELLNKTER